MIVMASPVSSLLKTDLAKEPASDINVRMHSKLRCRILIFLFVCAALVLQAQTPSPAFKVGVAKRDITPKEPVPMWGYGARHDALSTGVLDPLYITALVLQAGANKLAIVGLDLGRSPAEKSLLKIRERIRMEAGIQYSLIAGSHTHHGPVLELSDEEGKGKGKFDAALRYYKEMEDGIAGAIVEANRKLVPAKLAAGSMQLDGFNRNRHTKIEPKPVDRDACIQALARIKASPDMNPHDAGRLEAASKSKMPRMA